MARPKAVRYIAVNTPARLVKGPALGDRVVAFDLMTTIGIGFIAIGAVTLYNA